MQPNIGPNIESKPLTKAQMGGTVLAVIAVLGLLLALAQATVYYRSKGSAKFLGSEKGKVQAMQMAEAGVEENIADLGKRRLKPTSGMSNVVTYDHKTLDGGNYTSRLSTVALGPVADTVDLVSTGVVGMRTQSISTRLKLNKYIDTTRTPLVVVTPETTLTISTTTAPKLDSIPIPPMTIAAMPAVDATPEYASCMSSASAYCNICHLPNGATNSLFGAQVLNVKKITIKPAHKSHPGDYVTTDNSCDLYQTHYTVTTTMVTKLDTARTIVNNTTYDTTVTIDTAVKVQVLSWK